MDDYNAGHQENKSNLELRKTDEIGDQSELEIDYKHTKV